MAVMDEGLVTMDDQGLFAYENLSGLAPEKALARAEENLSVGWSHRGRYAPIAYGKTWPWFDAAPENAARNFHLHAWDMVNELLIAHTCGGDERLFHAACAVAEDWIGHFPRWEEGNGVEFSWYDMAVGLRSLRLAYLLDAGQRLGLIDERVAALFWTSLEEHRRYLEDDANIIFHNNHGFYQVVGQLAMARRFQHRNAAMARARELGEKRLKQMIDAQFTSEGVHREHSPDYHRMVYLSLRGVVAEGLIADPEIAALIMRIEQALMWFVAPDSTLVRFGDSDERKLIYKPADAERLWVTDGMRFLTSQGKCGRSPAGPAHHGFMDSGYFVARDRWPSGEDDFSGRSYLAQICCFHSRAHKHADDLSFVWYESGIPILIDAGRYGYFGKALAGSDLWKDGYWYSDPGRIYVERTRAHNTVEIDGANHPRKDVKPYGSALRRSGRGEDGIYYSEAEVRHGGVRFIRTLAWLPGKWLLVWDWLKDRYSISHEYKQWLHFPCGAGADFNALGVKVDIPGLDGPVQLVDMLGPAGSVMMQEGVSDEHGNPVQGFHSPSEKKLVPNVAIGVQRSGSSAIYATLLALQPVEPESIQKRVSPSGVEVRLRWSQGGEEYDLQLNRQVGVSSPARLTTVD